MNLLQSGSLFFPVVIFDSGGRGTFSPSYTGGMVFLVSASSDEESNADPVPLVSFSSVLILLGKYR